MTGIVSVSVSDILRINIKGISSMLPLEACHRVEMLTSLPVMVISLILMYSQIISVLQSVTMKRCTYSGSCFYGCGTVSKSKVVVVAVVEGSGKGSGYG